MKNFSKNDYGRKKSERVSRRSSSKNNNRRNNSQEGRSQISKNNTCEKNNFSKRENPRKRNDLKDNQYSNLVSEVKSRDFNQVKRRFSSNNNNKDDYAENSQNTFQLKTNNKNFEDWIWGKHSVFAALKSNRPINRIWCTSEIFSSEKFFLLLKDLKSIACSQTLSLENLINSSKSKSYHPIFVALDGITDPHNLGAIIRSAEAFDCKGIIIPQRRCAGLTGTVAKVAAGALEHIPVSRVVNLNRAIDELKKNGFLILGLSGEGQVPIFEFDQKGPLVVVVGAENKGISLLTQKKCDYMIKIPLKGKTSSLNASVAAAISLCYLSTN